MNNVEQLFQDHHRLLHDLSRKNISRLTQVGYNIEVDELYAIFCEVFMVAVQSWSEEQSKLTTFLTHCCNNKVTSMLRKHFASRGHSGLSLESELYVETEDDGYEASSIFCDENSGADIGNFEVQQALEYAMQNLSPFARLLIEYTLSPPEFIERELMAQEAKYEYTLDKEHVAHRRRNLNIVFVAGLLERTATDPSAKRFIRKALNEAKNAVLSVAQHSHVTL